jgi:hypothetical protein
MAAENLNAPVEEWGFDGLLAAIEQGSRADQHRIALAVETDPRGPVADQLEEVLEAVGNTRRAEFYRRILFSLACSVREGGPTARS